MGFKGGMVGVVLHMFLASAILFQELHFTVGRSTTQSEDVGGNVEEMKAEEEVQKMDFTVHILTKRNAELPEIHEGGEPPAGRTFRASDPLDPRGPLASTLGGGFFDDFETVDTIFQPSIEDDALHPTDDIDEDEHTPEAQPDDNSRYSSSEEDKSDAAKSQVVEESQSQHQADAYGAQYPYTETTRTSSSTGSGSAHQQSAGYQTHSSGSSSGGSGSQGPYEQTVTRRRVVLAGREGQPTTHTEYVETEHSSVGGGSQVSGNQYRTQVAGNQYPTQGSSGRQYPSGRSYTTYNQQYPTANQYPSSGSRTQTQYQYQNTRGARYDGPRYVDNNGHYIDANGRHLDSTGRYYDNSGRYQDATVTRTVTYQSGPTTSQRYTDSTGQTFSYIDSTGSVGRQYTNSYPTSGRTSSTGRQIGGQPLPLPTGGRTGNSQYTSQVGGTSGGSYGGTGSGYTEQTGSSSTQIGGTPINSYGGTQFYSGGQSYPGTYDPIVSQISNDPNCPTQTTQVTINGMSCTNAVSQVGAFVCYNYERVSTECCERCLQVKQAQNQGCEYGDRSVQCRDIHPYDCYNERNSQICCARCQGFRAQRPQAVSTCSYGDKTPRCTEMRQRSHLCYLPENQQLCCETCPRMANQDEPDCKWGNQNPELCSEPFDAGRRLRLNCYLPQVQQICCSTCKGLRDRIRQPVAGCEYGDHPIQISTARGVLGCGEYIRLYGVENCDGGEIAQKCCYTCYRYRNRRRQGQAGSQRG